MQKTEKESNNNFISQDNEIDSYFDIDKNETRKEPKRTKSESADANENDVTDTSHTL